MWQRIVWMLLFAHCVSLCEPNEAHLGSINEAVSQGQSTVEITAESIKLGFLLWRYAFPTSEQLLQNAYINKQKESLLAEEALKECIVNHAYEERLSGEFPQACHSADELCARIAGITRRNEIRDEFNEALARMPMPVTTQYQHTSSAVKKLALGTTIIVVSGGVLFFVSPIILPGSLIAAKATAASAVIKSTTVAFVSKVTLQSAAFKMSTLVAAHETKKAFDALPDSEKMKELARMIKTTKEIVSGASMIRTLVVGTPEQQLERLIKARHGGKSLQQRIIETHTNRASTQF